MAAASAAAPQETGTVLEAAVSSAAIGAVQLCVSPPSAPAQFQSHGPLPVTRDGLPAVHRSSSGAFLTATPLAAPQVPLTLIGATQSTEAPLLVPAQLQFHGPFPLTGEGVPVLQRLSEGASR